MVSCGDGSKMEVKTFNLPTCPPSNILQKSFVAPVGIGTVRFPCDVAGCDVVILRQHYSYSKQAYIGRWNAVSTGGTFQEITWMAKVMNRSDLYKIFVFAYNHDGLVYKLNSDIG